MSGRTGQSVSDGRRNRTVGCGGLRLRSVRGRKEILTRWCCPNIMADVNLTKTQTPIEARDGDVCT